MVADTYIYTSATTGQGALSAY